MEDQEILQVLAKQARLQRDEKWAKNFIGEFQRLAGMVARIDEMDIKDVEPTLGFRLDRWSK